MVRSTGYIKRAQDSLGSDGPLFQARPLAEGLVSVAVLDTPRAVRPLNDRDLKLLEVTQEQLFELGAKNLVAELTPLPAVAKPAASEQIGTITGSVYEVGRVAVPSQWASLAQAQNGTLLIALPTTDLVLYISESMSVAVEALRALARRTAATAPNPLSATAVLRWSDGRWVALP